MVNIESIIIYPTLDGNHFKCHVCPGICTDYGGISFSIQLLKTKKWFDERRFYLQPGDQLSAPETNRDFTITGVSIATKRPRYVTVIATLDSKDSAGKKTDISGGLAS